MKLPAVAIAAAFTGGLLLGLSHLLSYGTTHRFFPHGWSRRSFSL
jgi:hypothetical protein